jgi:hypothetical protein
MFGFKKRYPITPTWVNISPFPEKTTSIKDLLFDFGGLPSLVFWIVLFGSYLLGKPHDFEGLNKIILTAIVYDFLYSLILFFLLGFISDVRCWLFKKKPSSWVFNYRKELLYTLESSKKVQQVLMDWCEAPTCNYLSKYLQVRSSNSIEIICKSYKQMNPCVIQVDLVLDDTINPSSDGLFIYLTFITPKRFASSTLYALDELKLFLNEHTLFYRLA